MAMVPDVRVKRAYAPAAADDGLRVLVDRLWPRGISTERAALDHWLKEIAPSTELRRWYAHDPDRFGEFSRRYRAELESGEPADALVRLRGWVAAGRVTLLTAAKRDDISHAAVLLQILSR